MKDPIPHTSANPPRATIPATHGTIPAPLPLLVQGLRHLDTGRRRDDARHLVTAKAPDAFAHGFDQLIEIGAWDTAASHTKVPGPL